MRIEGASISEAARVVGASVTSVSGWVKKGAVALERMRAMGASGESETIAAFTIAFDEMWTYAGARRKEKRHSVRVWTEVMEEIDGNG